MRQRELILTHEHAGFDAIAALWAARQVYPHAFPVLPKQVRAAVRAFLSRYPDRFHFHTVDEIPWQEIHRIILVATHQLPPSIPIPPSLPVVVIDHRPPREPFPPHWTFKGEATGATTTLLVEQLRSRGKPIPPWDATLWALGIYEATEMFLHSRTTPRDLEVAAWLLGHAARPKEIRAYLRPLHLATPARVKSIMVRGVPSLTPEHSIAEAAAHMRKYGIDALPIVDPQTGQVLGIVTRMETGKALHHNLGKAPVARIMRTGGPRLHPQDPVERARELMTESGWQQIPVVDEKGHPVGVITAANVLRIWHEGVIPFPKEEIAHRLQAALPPTLFQLLQLVSQEAASLHMPLYVVGGFVRDLLLGVKNWDVDVVVEGDAIALARRLAQKYGGRARSHHRFGTAKWILPKEKFPIRGEGLPDSLDVVTARTEFYEKPTALPTVKPGSIIQDLQRRDFTINTLAIRLDGEHWGELLDLFGGVADLQQGIIRVLHTLSFIEDPTRILRGVRFEQRFDFRMEPRTEELLLDARSLLEHVSGARIAHELELILQEDRPERALRRLHGLHVLPHIHPDLPFDEEVEHRFQRLREAERQYPLPDVRVHLYLALWLYEIPQEKTLRIADRLYLRREVRRLLEDVTALRARVSRLTAQDVRPSEFVRQVERFTLAALFVVTVAEDHPRLWSRYALYTEKWRHIRPSLDGHMLQREYGITPGPQLGHLLRELRDALLDGHIRTPEEERRFLEERLR